MTILGLSCGSHYRHQGYSSYCKFPFKTSAAAMRIHNRVIFGYGLCLFLLARLSSDAHNGKCLLLPLPSFSCCCSCPTGAPDPVSVFTAELLMSQQKKCAQVRSGSYLSNDIKTRSITHARCVWKHWGALSWLLSITWGVITSHSNKLSKCRVLKVCRRQQELRHRTSVF